MGCSGVGWGRGVRWGRAAKPVVQPEVVRRAAWPASVRLRILPEAVRRAVRRTGPLVARLAAITVASALPGMVTTAPAQDFVAKSAQCVAALKRESPGTHIRQGLTNAVCGLPTPPTAYSGAPRTTFLASGTACATSLSTLPACGHEASLATSVPGGVVRVPLGGGACLHVLPLMLTDKTEGFTCNAVHARPACVRGVERRGGATRVTLASGNGRGAITAEITVPDAPEHHVPLFARSPKGPLFALVPSDVTVGGQLRDSAGFIAHHVEHMRSTCEGTAAHCRDQMQHQADRAAGELLRRVWTPRRLLSTDERKADYADFSQRIARGDFGRHDREKKLFARLILENEVSGSSPYQVLDAVIRNSGLSWGAHQIDIGANTSSEAALFWETLKAWRRAPGTGNYPLLRQMDRHRACLSQPIRNMFTEHLAMLYAGLPDMTRGMRADASRRAYETRFAAYLDEEVPPAARIGGLFQVSTFAWMYYMDVKNQRGGSKARALRRLGEEFASDAPEVLTCADVAAGEQRLVDHIKSITEEGEHYDIDRRVGNLRRFLERELGAGMGRRCSG